MQKAKCGTQKWLFKLAIAILRIRARREYAKEQQLRMWMERFLKDLKARR